jgi:hypothetical protein
LTLRHQENQPVSESLCSLGSEIVCVYKDHGISGAKSRDGRPSLIGCFAMLPSAN